MYMKLIFLGTGGSWPSKTRNVPSIAIKYESEVILFDCGEGTQRQFMHSTLSFMQISRIFISHFHGDHFLGLPGLIQSMYLNERSDPLEIYGPKGAEHIISNLLKLGYFTPSYDIIIQDVEDGQTLKFDKYSVSACSVNHNVPTLAYALEEFERPGLFNKPRALELGIPEGPLFGRLQKGESIDLDGKEITPDMVMGPPRRGRKFVYSGDTRPSKSLIKLASDCDVLVHDSTFDAELEQKANDYGHSSTKQAAEIAAKAGAKQLFLVHISPRYEDPELLESQAQTVFPNTKTASDLMEVEIKLMK
ncbi:MAG: ribonuclease Z [Thermoplasmata archaeon]|nr:MAG: ribonuclease Z [Thermoplasmata archaeon]